MRMTLARSDIRIAETENRARISEEYEPSVEAILLVTGHENLMDISPVLQRSIRLRNLYVAPLSCVQVSLLRRAARPPKNSPERNGVLNTLLLTISGILSGMLNT